MANYTVYGYIKRPDDCDVKLEDAKVYPYFKKVDSGSPDSKWTDSAYTTDDQGYYSFNLGDNALLGSEAGIKKGTDKIYIAVVFGGTGNRDSLDMSHTLFIDHTTINDDLVELNLDIEPKRLPILDTSTFPDAAILTAHNYTMSETSHTDTGWNDTGCYSTNKSQKLTYDNVDIFDGHQLVNTIYAWAEIADRDKAPNTSDSYSFVEAGSYQLKIKIKEKWNTEVEVTKDVVVKYNEPVMDFTWDPNGLIKGTEEITFTNTATCLDDRLSDPYTYKWVISDKNQDDSDNTQTVNNAAYSDKPTHQFQSAGDKTITLTCYWNDGFDDQEVSVTKHLTITAYDITPEFNWSGTPNNRGEDITFTPQCTGDTAQISKYDWVINDRYPAPSEGLYTFADSDTSKYSEGSSDNTQEVSNIYNIADDNDPTVKFHSNTTEDVKMTVTYNDGWKDVTKELTKQVSKNTYSLVPAIGLDDSTPISSDIEVQITNDTVDNSDLQYTVDWIINDYYAVYNPDNGDYGNNTTDNTVTINDAANDATQSHKFQNKDANVVKLTIRYDNGWQRQTATINATVDGDRYELTAQIKTDLVPVNNGFAGKVEVKYSNDNIGTAVGREIKETWQWDDKEMDDTSHVTDRADQDVGLDQAFTYQYPSRKPYSAVGGSTEQNINKQVKLDVRYNDGWEDNIIATVTSMYEATPYETSGIITHEDNITEYTH